MSSAISPLSLRDRYDAARTRDPKRYFRSIADDLGVSEAELLVAVHGPRVVRLVVTDLPALFADLARLGRVRTMTRNDDAVIEQDGEYRNLEFGARGMGQTVGDLDLRIFGWRWRHAYALADESPRGVRRSLQFFDEAGTSIHKVFFDDAAAFEQFTLRWRDDTDAGEPPVVVTPPAPVERADADIDVALLHREWDALRDTHDFHAMLRRLEIGRVQALRLAGTARAQRVGAPALRRTLDAAAAAQERIMIFVGNAGLVQIYIGTVHRVVDTAGWLNVLDPGFNLHVREEGIDSLWVVRKPTVDGVVGSLEAYDAQGRLVVQLFGKRLEGQATPRGWAQILEEVEATCER